MREDDIMAFHYYLLLWYGIVLHRMDSELSGIIVVFIKFCFISDIKLLDNRAV